MSPRHLGDRLVAAGNPDGVYDAFLGWVDDLGLGLYPHQDEAIIEVVGGNNVILATPTGSGKSMVATAAQFWALCEDKVSFYTAPIKALVSEKFFALCAAFGADNVGMLTGDASVNPDAPIICCTAEVLANIALREGADADIGLVVMDEFHYYSEPDRGWAWQVPLLTLPHVQFVLMSATLGDVDFFLDDLTERTGRDSVLVDDAERPVPLNFSWSLTPLGETLAELVETKQVPAYVVHFTQKDAVEHANSLVAAKFADRAQRDAINEEIGAFRFGAGFGRILGKMLRSGVGVHHAGMLPKYRRLVEQLAQKGLLTVICGTDTLGVGINVPIRTVLFTGLAKFDGNRQRILRTREFQQIAGRAGRAGYDTAGYVVVQAPEHVIENEAAKAKSAAKNAKDPKKKSKPNLRKPPAGTVVWTEQTYTKLVEGRPEPLVSRMKVDNSMLLNVVARDTDAFVVLRDLLRASHDDERNKLKLQRRALRLGRSLLDSGVLERLEKPDEFGRRYVLTDALPEDFALNQPLAHFALEAFSVLDPEAPEHALDLVSVVEAVLDGPRQVLFAQQNTARGEAVAEMKADGIEYEERMALLEEITWPRPLAELLGATFEIYRGAHPWLPEDALEPKAIVREIFEQGYSFTEFVSRHQLARSEGLVLRYLTDAYRTMSHTVPESYRTPEFDELVEWLGETVRQTDSSLLDEWEALTDPDLAAAAIRDEAPPPPRPLSQRERAFTVMIRNAMWRRVEAVARDDLDTLMRGERATAELFDPPREVGMTRSAWDDALEAYYGEHDEIGTGPEAHGPSYLHIEKAGETWLVRQTLADPEDHRDWVIEAEVDVAASDALGEAVVTSTAMRRFDGV